MSRINAVPAMVYGANTRPATTGATQGLVAAGATHSGHVPAFSGAPGVTCAGWKDDGSPCGARPAKGTDLCVGHLRKEGRL